MSEQRLIDANRLIDFIDCGHLRNPLELCFSESEVVNMLDSAPTVPAETVVHCRDCRKRNTPRCNMTHNMGGGRFLTCNEDLGYCNLAEMKHIEINKGEENK